MVFQWSLRDSMSHLQDSSQYHGWSQQCCSLDGHHSSSYFHALQSLFQSFGDHAVCANYNWYHFHFHVPVFFSSLARSRYLSLFSLSFSFTLWSTRTTKSTTWQVFFFLSTITWSGHLAAFSWSVCISKFQRTWCDSFSRTDSRLCIYHLFMGSNFNFLHNAQWITLFIQSYLVLYSLCTNLLYSLIKWLIVLSLSPHNLHQLFCCILSISAFTYLVLIVLFCVALKIYSVSLLRFLFLRHVQVFSNEFLLVCHLNLWLHKTVPEIQYDVKLHFLNNY